MKKKTARVVALVCAFCMLLSIVSFAAEEKKTDWGAKLDEALALHQLHGLYSNEETDYVREALIEMFEEDPEFFYEFINRIYGKDDRYSKYITAQKYDEAYSTENSMVGIGVVIAAGEDGYLTIDSLMAGPAMSAGLNVGDKFLAVDGSSVIGFLPGELANVIRGKEGTNVNITVLRGEETLSFTVQRAKVRVADASGYLISDKIELLQFGGINTFIDFMTVYDQFEEQGVNTIILDLRNNPGGNMDCFINLMDNIIPKKDVPYAMTWQSKPISVKIYKSEGYGWEFNKFIILVNNNTASAAEIMAGSLQDLGYAVVVGEQTFGKGMGQRHIETADGDEAIITALDIKRPTSGSYDGIGIVPDYKASIKLTPYKLPYLNPLVSRADASKIKTENVKGIEQRLSALGYFYMQPDDEWDTRTVHAINAFCRDNGLPMINTVCRWDLIETIDREAKKLETKYVATDEQFDLAVELAEQYAASDKKAECVPESEIDFKQD